MNPVYRADDTDRVAESVRRFLHHAKLIMAAPALLAALEDVELRCTQARLASNIGKKKGNDDFLRGALESIAEDARAAIDAVQK